jgi:hypothetical protein
MLLLGSVRSTRRLTDYDRAWSWRWGGADDRSDVRFGDPTRDDDPLRTTPEGVAVAVNAAARFNASLGVSYSPWVDFLPNYPLGPAFWPPPTDESFEPAVLGYFAENMARIVQWVADANAALGTCVAVRWVAFDQEVMCMGAHPEWAAAVTRKNDLFYNASKVALPGAQVQWYGRGDMQH